MHRSRFALAIVAGASILAACHGGPTTSALPSTQTQQQQQPRPSLTHALIDESGAIVAGAHIMRTRDATASSQAFSTAAGINLLYGGGNVQTKFRTAVVYWGFSTDPSGEEPRLNAFLRGVGGSSWISTDDQYYQIISGVKTFVSNPSGNFVGSWVDTSNAIPSHPTDSQIAAEAKRAQSHFGVSGLNVNIIVATAHNHNTSGFATQWCAYHSNSGTLVYTNLGYMTDAGTSCGENSVNSGTAGKLDGVTIVSGHEIAEAQTDPQPASGWVDANGEENGDKCAWTNLQNTSFSTGTFPTQPIWSNKVTGCVQ